MKRPQPQLVQETKAHYKSLGYSTPQATSIAWAEFFEQQDALYTARTGNWASGRQYDCYCFDCKKGNTFQAADTVRLFIEEHKNHKTKTFKK